MSFTDLNFITRFLPIFLIVYYLVPSRYRGLVLFAGSMFCYGLGDVRRLLVLLALSTVNFTLIRLLSSKEGRSARALLAAGISADAAVLIYYKYFSEEMILGVSFFTFMMIAALVDVYRKDTKIPGASEYFSFVFMFPKLMQGPVIPLKDVSTELRHPKVTPAGLVSGLEYFIAGMALKVVIADEIGKLWMSVRTAGFESVSTPLAWLGVIAFSMQLYFDFWGYSVMARGLGEMLGIPIMRNFNHPYMSVSVSEYYRRWHISLGRWFREYIYIPMGGNRKGNARHIANLFFVWLLTGIWHGTTANFIIWAGVLFILIILEKKVYGDFLERHRCLGHIYIYSVIPLTWAVFAVENTGELAAFFSRLFPFGNPDALMIADALHYGPSYIWVAVLAAAVSLPKTEMLFEKYKGSVWMQAGMFVLMWICIWLIATGSGNAFMYARF